MSFTHRQTRLLSGADNFIVGQALSSTVCASMPGPRFFRFFSPTSFICSLMVRPVVEAVGNTSAQALDEQKCLGVRLSLARAKVGGLIDMKRDQNKMFRKVTCPL